MRLKIGKVVARVGTVGASRTVVLTVFPATSIALSGVVWHSCRFADRSFGR